MGRSVRTYGLCPSDRTSILTPYISNSFPTSDLLAIRRALEKSYILVAGPCLTYRRRSRSHGNRLGSQSKRQAKLSHPSYPGALSVPKRRASRTTVMAIKLDNTLYTGLTNKESIHLDLHCSPDRFQMLYLSPSYPSRRRRGYC